MSSEKDRCCQHGNLSLLSAVEYCVPKERAHARVGNLVERLTSKSLGHPILHRCLEVERPDIGDLAARKSRTMLYARFALVWSSLDPQQAGAPRRMEVRGREEASATVHSARDRLAHGNLQEAFRAPRNESMVAAAALRQRA